MSLTTINGSVTVPASSKINEENNRGSALFVEILSVYQLALPTIVILLSYVVPPFLTASYVGRHFGHLYLDGYTLANLTANLLTLALVQGFYNACDTLAPQAFAASNYREVGLVVIRCFVATIVVMMAVNAVLFCIMDQMLIFFGQNPDVAKDAQRFYCVYAISFPFYAIYSCAWKFLSAQDNLRPLVVCTLTSTFVVLPICLEVFVRTVGFLGAALAITVFYIFESVSVVAWICIIKPHRRETWPGFSAWHEALKCGAFSSFLLLSVGGMLASLEWMYWEVLALLIGTLGVLPLSAHTIPTQVIFITFMLPLGIGIALAIRLGSAMTHNVPLAKRLACGTFVFSSALFAIMSLLVYWFRFYIFALFTYEAEVIELCDQIWFDVCLYMMLSCVFGINSGIAIGLGMQWTFGITVVVALWFLGMPASYYFAIIRGGGLAAAWICIWPPYVLVNAIMFFTFLRKDWDEISLLIRIREGMDLESLCLVESSDGKIYHSDTTDRESQ